MKHCIIGSISTALCIPSLLIATGFGGESSINGGKANIVISGNLTTYEGNVYELSEITFNKLIHKIPVYEKPSDQVEAAASPEDLKSTCEKMMCEKVKCEQESRGEHDPNIIVLKKNPLNQGNIFFKDLETVTKIETPQPDKIWVFYKDKKNIRKIEFVEIIMTSNGKTDHYLVERDKHIDAGEVKTPITNVKMLTISKVEPRSAKKCPDNKQECPNTDAPKKVAHRRGAKVKAVETAQLHPANRSTKIVRAS